MRALALTVLMLAAACGSTGSPAAPLTPEETVMAWLEALDAGGDSGRYVVPGQVDVVAAIGRPVDGPAIVRSGLSVDSEAAYWSSLAAELLTITGAKASSLETGKAVGLRVDGIDHSYVELVGEGGGSVIVVRIGEDGPLIDLIATLGPELVRPFTRLLDALAPADFDGPGIAESLRVGISDPDLDLPPQFYGEVQDLIAAIDR